MKPARGEHAGVGRLAWGCFKEKKKRKKNLARLMKSEKVGQRWLGWITEQKNRIFLKLSVHELLSETPKSL